MEDKRNSKIGLQMLNSPFKLPTDEEVFITREAERQEKLEQKEKAKNLKVWDKEISCNKGHLKRPKDSEFSVDPITPDQAQKTLKPKERNLISAAMEIVNSRKAQNQKSENIRDYVEQKKEIFRVEMKYRILKEEREKIQKKINSKETALKRSEEMLKKDQERFSEHISRIDLQVEEAKVQAEQEAHARKDRETEAKQLEQKKAAITAEINRNEEYLEVLHKHKEFLDQLTPPEWLQENQEYLETQKEKLKKEWISKKHLEDSGERVPRRKSLKIRTTNLEQEFEDLYQKGIIQVDDKDRMYFTEPEQLTSILKELEDNNLFLIELIQEMDHQLELAKSEFQLVKKNNKNRDQELRRNKEHLTAQLKSTEYKLNSMNKKKFTIEEVEESTSSAQNLREQLAKTFTELGFEEDSALQPIEMLKMLEDLINSLVEKLNEKRKNNEKEIEQLESEKEKERRARGRERAQELEEKKNQERIKLAQERAERPSFKKVGRAPVFKARIQKKKKQKVVKEVQKSEAEQIKEFIEETT